MALADYILCDKCDTKLIYDADNRVIDELEYRLTGRRHPAVDVLDVLCQGCSGVGGILIKAKMERRDDNG